MKFVMMVGTTGSFKRDYVKHPFEVDDDDLEGLEGFERAAVIEEVAREVMLNAIAWDWEEA